MSEINSWFEEQRSALGELQRLVADRARREKVVAETFEQQSSEAERDAQRAQRTHSAKEMREWDEYESARQAEQTSINSEAEARHTKAKRRRETTRHDTNQKYTTLIDTMRGRLQEKLWSADSQHEAWTKQAHDDHDELQRKVIASNKRLDAIWLEVVPVLARAGLVQEDVVFNEDHLPPTIKTDPIGKLQRTFEDMDIAAERLIRAPLHRFLGIGPTLVMIVVMMGLCAAVCIPLMPMPSSLILTIGAGVVLGLIARIVLGILAKRQIRDRGIAFGVYAAEANRAIYKLQRFAEKQLARSLAEFKQNHHQQRVQAEAKYHPKIADAEAKLQETLKRINSKYSETVTTIEHEQSDRIQEVKKKFETRGNELRTQLDAEDKAMNEETTRRSAAIESNHKHEWQQLEKDWTQGLARVAQSLGQQQENATAFFPSWDNTDARSNDGVPHGIAFGHYDVDLYALPDGMPFDPKLNPKEPIRADVPAFLPFPSDSAVLLKANDSGRTAAVTALQTMMLRFLTGLPAGKVRFTIIDPVGLGQNFAAFMHLADYDEKLVTSRIWTEPQHIDKRLADLTEHMENVIQKYLRNQYQSIEDYNIAAGEVAEPYRVLVIANFPTNFTPESARRLVSIMSSGPACGVCTLVSVDANAPMPRDFRLADLEQVAFNLQWKEPRFVPSDNGLSAFPLTLDKLPSGEETAAIIHRVGQASLSAARVEVPFDSIMPSEDRIWQGTTNNGFSVPIGRAGATRQQLFNVGHGTAQHALVAGKTGSGKSTLLHALITNLALHYSPDEAELYLIDFKEGVEFKPYATLKLPHARVIAIESEREFGLSVLQRLDGILRERGDRFRAAEVNDLAAYRATENAVSMPRILLIVDEFQNFFIEDDKLSQEAALLLDRLVRQGRAFGVHVLLGSQTLGGAYSLARSTIDQMAVRIALQCSEADAQLILSKENTAARLLNRPGEAIYNDANGRIEGNDPFQVVWLDDDRREELLKQIHDRGNGQGRSPIVFEGNAKADVTRNKALDAAIDNALSVGPPSIFLGEPIAIKEPTSATFRVQSGANMLLLGQHEEAALGLLTAAIVSLRSRFRTENDWLNVVDGSDPDSDYAGHLRNTVNALGLDKAFIEPDNVGCTLQELVELLNARQEGTASNRSPRFVIVNAFHRLRDLKKPEDDFGFGKKDDKPATPGENFAKLLRDGPAFGIHVIVWCDSLTNLQRLLDRQALREFTLRVLFQMSASDSSHLIDTPLASRLGRNRALFVEEGTERPEKFRPYGLPPGSWLREVGDRLLAKTEV